MQKTLEMIHSRFSRTPPALEVVASSKEGAYDLKVTAK